jgi:hypothetical protein
MYMKTLVMAIGILTFLVTETVASFTGLDLRIWSSWLYGVASFLAGFLLGITLTNDLIESLKVGALLAFLTLISGVAMRRHKRRYEGMAVALLQKYGKVEDTSSFAKLVRRLLSKYK